MLARPALALLVASLSLGLAGCDDADAPLPPPDLHADADVHPQLLAQAGMFDPAMLQPAPGIHVAVGHALSNVIALEGPDGLIIIDSTEGRPSATAALAALREVTDKPIRALILTHNHADHVFGGQVFVEEAARNGVPDLPVWAHALLEDRVDRVVNLVRDAIHVRSMRMFGSALPHAQGGSGIGFRLRFDSADIALARPTHTFQDRATVTAAGITLELVHAPGETDDQLFAWWPERRALFPGDNIYQAFPNLYTIRGTSYRDVRQWVDSLDAMRDLGAQVLVPQHTVPVVGAAQVEDVLTAYRDGIQYVHDQTIRGINQGRTPDQLAAAIRLPPHLAEHPWLAEHYGRVPWSVRGIYSGTLGWFDGRSASLEPLPPDERARRYAAAFAAGQDLPTQVAAALDAGEWRWAAELSQLWLDAQPDNADARVALAQALQQLGRGHINANAANWYTTEAGELRGELDLTPPPPGRAPTDLIDGLPLDPFMQGLATRLRAEDTLEVDWKAVFTFTDVDQRYLVHVRRGVCEVRPRTVEQLAGVQADLVITTTAKTWKRLAAGKVSALEAATGGQLDVDGGVGELSRLLRWFERG